MKLLLVLSAVLCAATICAGQSTGSASGANASSAGKSSGGKSASSGKSKGSAASGQPAAESKPYVIGPLDILDVRVWGNPNVSGIFSVGPDGMVPMPLIGQVKADGLTVAELKDALRDKLSAFINSPEVNVQVARILSKKYYVLGGVNHQGEFPLTGDTTVLDAFANCGGFKDFANQKKIYILRGTQRFPFNYKEVSQGKHMEQNIYLENGDKIFVPE
jgi:polysaccharide export outer membrane protein